MHDPFAQFLGVNEPADALTLLGLTLAQCEPVQIEAALRDRLARVYQHPEGRSEQAEQVRPSGC